MISYVIISESYVLFTFPPKAFNTTCILSPIRVSVDLKVESEDRWLFWSVMEDQVLPEYEADYRKLGKQANCFHKKHCNL